MKKLPNSAIQEIHSRLAKNLRISAEDMEEILERNGVRGDVKALQRSYRKSVAQRYMASLRDETGKREILAAPNPDTGEMEYLVLDACNDVETLKRIEERLENQRIGLSGSSSKVRCRVGFLSRFMHWRKGT